MSMKILHLILLIPSLISTEPIILTDKTWSQMLTGEWMVEFYAPWCPACKQFKPVWDDFSNVAAEKNVKVGAVDVEEYPGLTGRFSISALPTVYHIKDGVFRQYTGERSIRTLRNYIENQEWQNTEPLSPYFGPNSITMIMTSFLFDLSALIKNTHTSLKDDYDWPSWLIYTAFGICIVSLGVLLGFGFLQIFDYFFPFTPAKASPNTIPNDADELDEDEAQSTDENKTDNNTSEAIATDQTVRQRRLNN